MFSIVGAVPVWKHPFCSEVCNIWYRTPHCARRSRGRSWNYKLLFNLKIPTSDSKFENYEFNKSKILIFDINWFLFTLQGTTYVALYIVSLSSSFQVQYSTVQYSTVQYSTVQVTVLVPVQYFKWQWTIN